MLSAERQCQISRIMIHFNAPTKKLEVMGNSTSLEPTESWQLSDLFEDKTLLEYCRKDLTRSFGENGSPNIPPQINTDALRRILQRLRWPSGRNASVSLEMLQGILDSEIYGPIVKSNIRQGGVGSLLRVIATILDETGRDTWANNFSQAHHVWELPHHPWAMDMDSMFALAQFTFLFLAYLTKRLTLAEFLLHTEYPIIPRELVSRDDSALTQQSVGSPEYFLVLIAMPKAVFGHTSSEDCDNTTDDLKNWETILIRPSLKDLGRVAPEDRRSHFVEPIKKSLKLWVPESRYSIIDSESFKFLCGPDAETASLMSVQDLSSQLFDCVLHRMYIDPTVPVMCVVLVLETQPLTTGVVGTFISSTLKFLICTYQPFFLSSCLSLNVCPMATRMEAHKTWLSCLLLLMSHRSTTSQSSTLADLSFATEIESMGRKFQWMQKEKQALLKTHLHTVCETCGISEEAVVLPPWGLYQSTCLEATKLFSDSPERKPYGIVFMESVIAERRCANEFLYYLMNVLFLHVRSQSVLMEASPFISFDQLNAHFSMSVPIKHSSVTLGRLFTYPKSTGHYVDWNADRRVINQLSPCLAFDFLSLSFRQAALGALLILCHNAGLKEMERALVNFDAVSPFVASANGSLAKQTFFANVEDCFMAMTDTQSLRSQTSFLAFYTLVTKNRLFRSVPLVSPKAGSIVMSLLELMVSIMVHDNKHPGNGVTLPLHGSQPALHMCLSMLVSITGRGNLVATLFQQRESHSPAWLFASVPTNSLSGVEQKRVTQLQSRIKGLSVGDMMCQVCLRLMEWNLRVHREIPITEYLIGLLINLRRSPSTQLHWSVSELVMQHIEVSYKLLLSRLLAPRVLAENQELTKGNVKLHPVDFVTNHLELLAAHAQALTQFVAVLLLPEQVEHNKTLLYTLVRGGSKAFQCIRNFCFDLDQTQVLTKTAFEPTQDVTQVYKMKTLSAYRFIRHELLPTAIYLEDLIEMCLLSEEDCAHVTQAWHQINLIGACCEQVPMLAGAPRFHTSPEDRFDDVELFTQSSPDMIALRFANRWQKLHKEVLKGVALPVHPDSVFAYRLGSYRNLIQALYCVKVDVTPVTAVHGNLCQYVAWDMLYLLLLRSALVCHKGDLSAQSVCHLVRSSTDLTDISFGDQVTVG
eukprot:Blabericola_migrator_1__12395@NODE_77_length_15155_cov_63_173383_g69_i0_p1_GENE_NODE_77_length_15155_cov_63_173383_g69_i0NODE_77_length_15155_cov_63_173383_g69_i0_p1_ORF_typecomplete_len1151_score185_76Dymeclin/PF09742_9/1_4e19_NODE_77_length_15155_cov_63_173383_g69_i030536505